MEQQKSSVGGIVGTIIIISIIILGGLYFWGKRIEESKAKQNMTADTSIPTYEENEMNSIQNTSSSDDLDSIEGDLNTTNLENLDADIEIEME